MKRLVSLLAVLILVASACGEESPASQTDNAVTTTEAPVTTTTTAEAAGEAMHDDDEAMHDDDEAMHDDDEAMHDDDDGMHDDDDGMHDDAAVTGGDDVAFDRVIEIVMTEFAFEPASISVTAGETIKFVAHNQGLVEHELRLSNDHRIEEHIASGHADHGEGGGHHDDGDVSITLLGGESGELVVTFPEDTSVFTEIACLIPGHYESGMKGTVQYGS